MEEKLKQLIARAENLKNSPFDNPEFKAWRTDVLRFLKKQYGEESTEVTSFDALPFYGVISAVFGYQNSAEDKLQYQKDIETTILYLKNYLSDCENKKIPEPILSGTKVFIGHGQSKLWHEVKDFIQDRLHLQWDEFNRVPVAGITNISRLSEMLNNAAIAFLILTAEDEQSNGSMNPRMNVVHEAGLFQGKLGFEKAIVLLEEGCEEFSNINGLGQIRFPKGNISAAFEDIRRVLERERLIDES
jgi:predicted nucleotide-binding protein